MIYIRLDEVIREDGALPRHWLTPESLDRPGYSLTRYTYVEGLTFNS